MIDDFREKNSVFKRERWMSVEVYQHQRIIVTQMRGIFHEKSSVTWNHLSLPMGRICHGSLGMHVKVWYWPLFPTDCCCLDLKGGDWRGRKRWDNHTLHSSVLNMTCNEQIKTKFPPILKISVLHFSNPLFRKKTEFQKWFDLQLMFFKKMRKFLLVAYLMM